MSQQGVGGIPLYPTEACQRFDQLLPDYLEGQNHPDVIAHAADCAFCGAVLADLLLVRAEAGEIGGEEPPARLWANVRARLVEEGLIRPSGSRPAWLDWFLRPVPAASFAALLLCGFLTLRSLGYLHHAHSSSFADIVDPRLEESVGEMERAFHDQSSSLDPSVRTAYEQGLKALNSEIDECRASLSHQPDDGLAREYLVSAVNEKAAVL